MMRLLKTFGSEAEAHMVRGMLAARGIDATVHRFSRYRAIAAGGWLLRVPSTDYARAESLLKAKDTAPDMDEYVYPDDASYRRCPQCRSVNVNAAPMPGPLLALVIATLGLALLVLKRDWTCAKCGCQWRGR